MTSLEPPTKTGPLGQREARLAWGLLFPTIAIVSAVVVLPLLAIFWISFKPIGLADLRPPAPVVREALRGSGDEVRVQYRIRNSSQQEVINDVTVTDTVPAGVTVLSADPRCEISGQRLSCDLGTLEGGARDEIEVFVAIDGDVDAVEEAAEASEPIVTGSGKNILTNLEFTTENFAFSFSLPNFYFHATTTYDILRVEGVEIGKRDFMGPMRAGV